MHSVRGVVLDFDRDVVVVSGVVAPAAPNARPWKKAIVALDDVPAQEPTAQATPVPEVPTVVCATVGACGSGLFRWNHERQTRRIVRFLRWAEGLLETAPVFGAVASEVANRQISEPTELPTPPPTPPATPPATPSHGLDDGLEPLPWDPTVRYEPHEYEYPRTGPPAVPPPPPTDPNERAYLEHGLLYVRYDAPIEVKADGKRKIGGRRPAFSKITKQPAYCPSDGRYYSLLMGREYQAGRYLMLLDVDNKDEEGTTNGLEFRRLLDLDRFGAPTQRTPSGGFHYLFHVDATMADRIRNRTTLKFRGVTYNVDVKFRNALMNCAPSRIDGYGAYEWLNPERLADVPRLPDELFEIIAAREVPRTSPSRFPATLSPSWRPPRISPTTASSSAVAWRRPGWITTSLGSSSVSASRASAARWSSGTP